MTWLVLSWVVVGCRPISLGPAVALPEGPPPVDRGVVANQPLAEAVDVAVLTFLEEAEVPGMGLALVAAGELRYSAGYGWAELETERAFTADTLVLLSSVSKTLVGVAALQAVEAGRAGLDDPASDHLPFAFDATIDGERPVTLRHLLTHTSPVTDTLEYGRSYVEGDPAVGLADFVEGYLTDGGPYWRRANLSPRDAGEFVYSNVGMATAALALGAAADRSFAELVDREILDPLGMARSAYFLADLPEAPAVPYARSGRRFRPYAQYGFPTYPDGALRSTPTEMGRFLAAIGGRGTLGDVTVLSEDAVDTLLTVDRGAGTDEDGQAIAWARRRAPGRVLFGHNGGDFGSAAELWLDRDAGVGIVTVFNAHPPVFDDWWTLQQVLLDLIDTP